MCVPGWPSVAGSSAGAVKSGRSCDRSRSRVTSRAGACATASIATTTSSSRPDPAPSGLRCEWRLTPTVAVSILRRSTAPRRAQLCLDSHPIPGAAGGAGRRPGAVLLESLDAPRPADGGRWEAEALDLIGATARRLADAGATPTEVVAIYLRARQPLLGEIGSLGRRRALDATQLAALFERAVGLLDRLLLHLVATHADIESPRPAQEAIR